MMYWIVNIGLIFVFCVFCAGFLIPQILLIAYRKQLFDEPDERKLHHLPVPRLGGIAFNPVIFLSIALTVGCNISFGYPGLLLGLRESTSQMAFLFCSITILYLVGIADDLIGIRYRAKFIVQIICGCFLIASGIWLKDLHGLFGIHEVSPYIGYPLTVLLVVFIINSINLIDGIDGLASGLCSCAVGVYGVAFFLLGQHVYSILSFATLGVLMPFFYYNVFGDRKKHKKIFMGDTGSLTIGMMISFLSIQLSMSLDDDLVLNPIAVAFSPLVIPCFDVLRVYWHRVRNRQNPFLPDRNHIHHKLLALGIGYRKTLILILLVSVLTIICTIQLSTFMNITIIFALELLIWTFANILLTNSIRKNGNKIDNI